MLSQTRKFSLSILHFQFVSRVPPDTEMNCQTGDDEAHETNGKRPRIGAGCIEKVAADPGAEGAAEAEADFQKSEDQTDLAAGKDIADDRTVGRIAGAVTDAVEGDREIDQP